MVNLREAFARALTDAARGIVTPPFRSLDTARGYWEQLQTVLNDKGATYPHGCAQEVLTRIQALTPDSTVSIEELAQCQTLNELQYLLARGNPE